MVDLGAVGVDPDPAQWADGTDYSHVSRAFEDVYLADPPYIDQEALAAAYDDWEEFLAHSVANGYNAVSWPGFVEFATFADVPDGPVYPEGDPHVARALALRDAFGPFWERAAELGVKVFLRTDMPTLTPQLAEYFDRRFGCLDTENPELWEVYAAALDELYAAEPALSGILIRIGEGGNVYQEPGWDYYSEIAVRTVDAVRTMLETYSAQAEATRARGDLPHVERRDRRRRRHAHRPGVVPRGARRHRLAGAHRVDEVHARRLLQLAAAERDARDGRAAPHRRVPEPPRVRGVRLVPQRSRARVPVGAADASSSRTRTSRASGPGRRTAVPGGRAR